MESMGWKLLLHCLPFPPRDIGYDVPVFPICFRLSIPSFNQHVGWLPGGIQHFTGSFDSSYWKCVRIDQAYLSQYRCLVPVNTLTGYLSVFKLDNHDNGNFHPFAGGGDAGQHPWHFDRMGKLMDQFVNQAVFSDRAGDALEGRVRWMMRDEIGPEKWRTALNPTSPVITGT
jgi:hypothetical protein